ncbi:MAG: RNA polymerase sigma factor [Bacteroidota bacterium]
MKHRTPHFLEVIETYQGIITSLCHAYYSSVEDRKDVRQEIILQLWKSFDTFKGKSKISTWIYRVSLNTILSRRREEEKRPDKDLLTLSQIGERGYFYDDNDQFFNYLLSKLKDEDKAILILQLEGYGNNEIASIVGITMSNVSTRLHRIKSSLREKLKIKIHAHTKV